MLHRYKHIVKLTCIHDFFGDAPYRYVQLQPTAATQQTLSNHRISFVPKNGGFHLTCETNMSAELLTEPLSLLFIMNFTDPYWSNYTEIGERSDDVLFYADNLQPDSILTGTGYISNNTLKVAHHGLPLTRTGLDEVIVENSYTGEHLRCTHTIINEATAWLNLKSLDEGVYVLKNQDLKFVKLRNDVEGAIILCHVVMGPEVLAGEPLNLILRFSSKEILLRYYLPKEALKNANDLIIVNEEEETVFGQGEENLLADRPMISFTSLKKYKYTNQMREPLHLKRRNGLRGGVTILKNLPLPSRDNLCRMDNNGNKVIELFLKF